MWPPLSLRNMLKQCLPLILIPHYIVTHFGFYRSVLADGHIQEAAPFSFDLRIIVAPSFPWQCCLVGHTFLHPSTLCPLSYCLKLVPLGSVKNLKSKCSLYLWMKSLQILFLCFSSCLIHVLLGNVLVQSVPCGLN